MSDIESVPLEIDFGELFTVPRVRSNSEQVRLVDRSSVRFELNRKQTKLGDVVIDQWWIPLPGLYGDRKRKNRNYQEILDCFWGWCQHAGSAADNRHVQESFILATLLPEARSNGARRVFRDAFVTGPSKEAKLARYAEVPTLESMLKSTRQETLDSAAFIQKTGEILGAPEYDDEVRDCYDVISREIFDDACAALEKGDANGVRIALTDWRDKMRTISRRSGRKLEKRVLDVLSYECRAAFHRAYSATWLVLLEALKQRFGMTFQEELFHRFWHLDHTQIAAETPNASRHLFHGHIFGLHPAFGDFMLTKTGAEMFGDFLSAANQDSYQRLIQGLLIAVYHYDQRHQNSTLNRTPKETTDADVESTDAKVKARRRGTRRLGHPVEDSDDP